jgi:hypothetical protein
MTNREFLPLIALIGASLLAQGCAGMPKAAAEAPAPAPANTASEQELSARLDPMVAEAAKGYDRVVKNGELFFCKREQPVGSKMYTTVCITEAQLRENAINNKRMKDGVMQQGRRCMKGPGCNDS